MKISSFILLIYCLLSVAGGQVLFKIASHGFSDDGSKLWRAVTQPVLILGFIIYLLAALVWLWVLRDMKLSDAYPFMALTFLIVPLFSMAFLGEPITGRYWIGSLLIVSGIVLLVRE